MWGSISDGELGGVETETFDEVVLATPANVAPLILVGDDADTRKTRQHLQGFPYEHSTVVIHRDRRLMPTLQKDWAAMNMVSNTDQTSMMFSMWASHRTVLDIDESELGPLFQTWNPFIDVEPGRLLKRIHFERSIMTPATKQHIQGLAAQQGKGGLWFCGAYALNSIPLQENGVRSALHIAERLGAACPWAHEIRDKQYKSTSDVRDVGHAVVRRAVHTAVAALAGITAWALHRRSNLAVVA